LIKNIIFINLKLLTFTKLIFVKHNLMTTLTLSQYEKQYAEEQKQKAGHIEIYDFGFQKIDKNPICEGTCQEQNVKKIIQLWTKLPKQKFNLSIRIYLIKQKIHKQNISHTHIYDKKNNRLIDISNGQTKMLDYDIWFNNNCIIKYTEITWNYIDDLFKQGYRVEDMNTYEEHIEYLLRHILNLHNVNMRK